MRATQSYRRMHNTEFSIAHTTEEFAKIESGSDEVNKAARRGFTRRAAFIAS
jgi:hypothetical protein